MWTEQTVETLRKFALEGRSAAWIASALGAPSRNAVIGKANRIGIKLNGLRSPSSEGDPGFELPPPAAAWGRTDSARGNGELRSANPPPALPWRSRMRRPPDRAPAMARERLRADRRVYEKAEIGEMRRIALVEISDLDCRWPVGDPMAEDFAFCGLPIARGHAYCPGHCRLVYRPNA
jgi:GcrA cell cycle regulator